MVLSTACINLNLMQVCLPRNPDFFFHPFGFIFDKFQKKKKSLTVVWKTPQAYRVDHTKDF